VQAGIFGPDLERALREVGQTVGHFPQSFDLATVGGWMATRGAGQFSNRYGNAADIVRGLTVVLANGDIVTIGGRAPVESVGPDLLQLFVGSEGTLGVITEVELVTHDIAPARAQAAYRFDTFAQGLEACRIMARRGALPAVARLYDEIETQRSLGAEGCGLIILDEGTADQVAATMAVVFDVCASATPLDESLVDHWLGHRNNVSSLAPLWEKGYVVDTVEVAGTWDQLPALHEAVVSALRDIPGVRNASVHQSHAYPDGACLYFTFAGEPGEQSADAFYRACWDAASHATMACGASLSHHHGVGRNRAPYVEAALGTSFGLLSSIKHALDPQNIMNPGVLGFSS
jgi:alkyldihydroxyacetonephosphate synthase